uniref:SH3 domain-containing protein n=1 Tax=Ascaris lumbricoides TaxID=6252 RepID=A0A0M3HHV1_ASCLU
MSHGDEVQAWQKKHTNEGLSGPAQIIPRNAETTMIKVWVGEHSMIMKYEDGSPSRSMAGIYRAFKILCWNLNGSGADPIYVYRALYAYKPQNVDELELCENDIVFVVEKCDDGWYIGEVIDLKILELEVSLILF